MTNQQHIFAALVNIATAFANNSGLKKYRTSAIFMLGCDGFAMNGCVYAGEAQHIEKHLFNVMAEQPQIALVVKNAMDRLMQEPELAAQVLKLQEVQKADDIINNVLKDGED